MADNKNDYQVLEPHSAVKLVATDSAADILRYAPPYKCRIRQVQAHVGGSDATACVIKFDKRATFGSDTGRGDGDLATITLPASSQAGKVNVDTPSTRVTLEPGEEMVAQVTTASTADKAVALEVLVDKIAEADANMTDISET